MTPTTLPHDHHHGIPPTAPPRARSRGASWLVFAHVSITTSGRSSLHGGPAFACMCAMMHRAHDPDARRAEASRRAGPDGSDHEARPVVVLLLQILVIDHRRVWALALDVVLVIELAEQPRAHGTIDTTAQPDQPGSTCQP